MPRKAFPARTGRSDAPARFGESSLQAERWLAPFLVGISVGAALGVLLVRLRAAESAAGSAAPSRVPDDEAERRWERVSQAWEGAVESLASVRDALLGPGDIDLEGLRRQLAGVPGAARVRVVAMGDGIVEVLGSADDDATARNVVDLVAGQEGVNVVVNRIWTPSAAAPGDA